MEACLPSSLQQNANDVYNKKKKALAKWNCSLHFHITSASTFLQRTHNQSEMWNRIPVCRKFYVQIPSRRRTNEQKKQARGGRSCAGDEGQGRAGVSRLCGAPASHRGAWTVLGTTKPWPVRGPGIRAALKWLPALRLPRRDAQSQGQTALPGCPTARERPPPSSRRDAAKGPRIWGTSQAQGEATCAFI